MCGEGAVEFSDTALEKIVDRRKQQGIPIDEVMKLRAAGETRAGNNFGSSGPRVTALDDAIDSRLEQPAFGLGAPLGLAAALARKGGGMRGHWPIYIHAGMNVNVFDPYNDSTSAGSALTSSSTASAPPN